MVLSSSLAAGFATASLQALQPNFSFKVSVKTLVAFAIGSIMAWIYWRILLSASTTPRQRRLRVFASVLLFFAGVAGFVYPTRFIAPNNYRDVIVGLIAAFCGLAGVAVLLLFCKRFLDNDSRDNSR